MGATMKVGWLERLWRDESAQDLAEYALLLALLAVLIVTAVGRFGQGIADLIDSSEDCLRPAMGGGTPANGSEPFGQCKKG
ncbi:MAG: hypothetical protein ABFS34_11125 [Gemmatimonadota bacterium]